MKGSADATWHLAEFQVDDITNIVWNEDGLFALLYFTSLRLTFI